MKCPLTMNTLADIKRRLTVGQRLLCVENTYRPELDGSIRTITRVLTNQIVWTWDGSKKPLESNWTRWPPAKHFEFIDGDTFSFMFDTLPIGHKVTLRFL